MEPFVLSGAHTRWVHDCCWLAAGRLAVSCGFEGAALVREVPAAAAAACTVEAADGLVNSVTHLKHDGRVRACCSLDGSWLATASGGTVHCWDGAVAGGCTTVSLDQALRSISLEHMLGEVQTLSGTAAPSGGMQMPILAAGTAPKKQARRCSPGAASTTATGIVAMLDLRTSGSTVGALVGHTDTVWHVHNSTGRPQLVCSASADGSAKVWDIRTQQVLHTVRGGHRGGIRRCTFAGEGHQQGHLSIVTGGFDRTIRVHTLTGEATASTDAAGCATNDREETSRLLARLDGYCFGLDASERWIVAGAGNPDYGVRLWGPLGAQGLSHELNHPHKLLGNTEHASCVAFSPCGHRLLTGGEAGVMRLWDLDTAAPETDDETMAASVHVERQRNTTGAIEAQRSDHCKRRRVVEKGIA